MKVGHTNLQAILPVTPTEICVGEGVHHMNANLAGAEILGIKLWVGCQLFSKSLKYRLKPTYVFLLNKLYDYFASVFRP